MIWLHGHRGEERRRGGGGVVNKEMEIPGLNKIRPPGARNKSGQAWGIEVILSMWRGDRPSITDAQREA